MRRLIFRAFGLLWLTSGFSASSTEYYPAQEDELDNEALLQQIELSDFESLLDIAIEHNVDWEVGSATKSNKKSTRTPAAVTVISHEQIKMYGYKSVAEVLAHVAGFSHTDDFVQSNFGVRGIHPGSRAGNRNIKVMLDSQPISFRATSQNFIDENLIPISLVERIEVIKGPVSALYGANAFLAVVNIISKTSEEFVRKGQKLTLQWQHSERSSDGYMLELAGGEKIAGWDTSAALSIGKSAMDGLALPRTSPDYQDYASGISGRHMVSLESDSKPLSFYLKTRYLTEQQDQWQVALHYQRLNADNPFADLNALRDSGYSRVGLYNSFVSVDHLKFFADGVTGIFRLSYKDGGPLGSDRVELGSDDFYYERNLAYHSYDFSADLNWHSEQSGHWLLGIDYASESHDLETFERVEKQDGSVTPLSEPQSRSIDNQAVYFQWLAGWGESLETIVGLRFDHNDIYNNKTSYRFGAVYPIKDNHSIKLLFGSSYQAPSMELLYRQSVQRGDVIGNPDLKPQEAQTMELIATGTLGQHMRYNLTLYRSKVEDLVVYRDDANNLTAINAASADTEGMELELGYDSDSLSAYFNLGWQNIEMQDSSLFVLENRAAGELFPEYTANVGVSYRFEQGWRLSFDNRFNDERPASTNNVLSAETFYNIDAYIDSTLTLQGQIKWFDDKALELALQIHDLWDNRYVQPGFGGIDIPTQGRRYTLSISKRF